MRKKQAWGNMARVTAMTPQAKKPIEEVLCSKTRTKIFGLLNDLGQLNVSDIARRLSSSYEYALSNLTVLEENDLVRHLTSGRIRYYRLNEGCSRVSALRRVILEWQK